MMQRETRWILLTIGLTLLLLSPMAAFNCYIDPMWTFAHSNDYNTDQMPFDERQQKTNYLYFQPESYDALLIGSSRCTYMDAREFEEKVYNYGLSNIQLNEYVEYMDYAVKQCGAFDTVYLGLEFSNTNENRELNQVTPQEVIAITKEPGYRFKLLVSYDTLEYSWKNYTASQEKQYPINFAYSREQVKRLSRVPVEQTWQMLAEGKEKYRQDIYCDYVYTDIPGWLEKMKQAAPGSRFVAFTTPVHDDFFALLLEMDLYEHYEQWLRDCVASFGTVYHFMYHNDITAEIANFYDGSHVYPDIATKMIDFMQGRSDGSEDFGMVLTTENIEESLRLLRENLQLEE